MDDKKFLLEFYEKLNNVAEKAAQLWERYPKATARSITKYIALYEQEWQMSPREWYWEVKKLHRILKKEMPSALNNFSEESLRSTFRIDGNEDTKTLAMKITELAMRSFDALVKYNRGDKDEV